MAKLTSVASLVAVSILLGFGSNISAAAEGEDQPTCITGGGCTIQDLKTPTSPAFVLIGVSPTLVERPSTPHDVAVTVYNAVQSSGGLPRDFALEVAPYWLFSHPTLKYDKYIKASPLRQLLYNATLSVATVNGPSTTATPGFTDLGLGFRTHLFLNFATPEQEQKIAAAEKALGDSQLREARKIKYQQTQTEMARNSCDEKPSDDKDCAPLRARLQKLHDQDVADDKALADGAKALQDATAARSGLITSIAGAVSGRTPDGSKVSWKEPRKEAGWLNIGYKIPSFDILAVGRYIHVSQAGSLGFADVGGRLDWVAQRFGLSVEYLHRFVLSQPDGGALTSSTRLTGTLEIAVSNSVFLSATAGQDAATESQPSGFLTLLGISFQASRERKLTL